jgi:hypothetical protein
MFEIYCPVHDADVLLGVGAIRQLTHIDGLIVVELECDDGERLRHYTGRRFHESQTRRRHDVTSGSVR